MLTDRKKYRGVILNDTIFLKTAQMKLILKNDAIQMA